MSALERDAEWLDRRKMMIYTDAQRERFCDWVSRLMADGVSEDNARETAFKGIFQNNEGVNHGQEETKN